MVGGIKRCCDPSVFVVSDLSFFRWMAVCACIQSAAAQYAMPAFKRYQWGGISLCRAILVCMSAKIVFFKLLILMPVRFAAVRKLVE